MSAEALRDHIAAAVPELEARIQLIADFQELIRRDQLPQSPIFAFVMPLGLTPRGEGDAAAGSFLQQIDDVQAVVLVVRASGDVGGGKAVPGLDLLIWKVIDAVCGADDTEAIGVSTCSRPVDLADIGDRLLSTRFRHPTPDQDFTMTEPIKWKTKIILAKVETTYGVDPTPSGSVNALLMTNVVLTPMDGEDAGRDLEQPFLGAQPSLPSALRVRMTGNIELAPSGTPGTAPAWGPLMLGLGCAETIEEDTSVTYTPLTEGHHSLYFKFWIGPTLHMFRGARGTARLRATAQGLPYLELDYIGLFLQPAGDVARPAVTLSGFKAPQIVSHANTPVFTIDGVPLVLREFILDLGNQVEPRLLVGREQILITDRIESASARVEAVPLSTYNPYALALDADARVPIVLRHGTGAGRISTLTIPTAQQKRLSGFENSQNVLEWPLKLTPLPDTGDDQWSLALT